MTIPSPLISIIVPIYKVENYLIKCIESIINQTYRNLEIILINDGSPDACSQICDDYSEVDTRIIVIHQENKGLSGARNAGLNIAKGDYIGFVDSDDWIEPDMYASMLKIALENDLDIVECGINKTNDEKFESPVPNFNEIKLVTETNIRSLKRIIKRGEFSVWRRLFKKELVGGLRFVEGKNSEDVYFTIDTLKKAKKIGIFPFPFYNYRFNPNSITGSSFSIKKLDSLDAGLYLYNVMSKDKTDKELNIIVEDHLMGKLIKYYKLLNYHPQFDEDHGYRKKIKSMIREHYPKVSRKPIEYRLAYFLPLRYFHFFISVNKNRRRFLGALN